MDEEKNNSQKKIAVAQLGARMHYAVPIILNNNSLLSELYTDFYDRFGWFKKISKIRLFPGNIAKLLKKAAGRRIEDIPARNIKSDNLLGIHYKLKFMKSERSNGAYGMTLAALSSLFASRTANKIAWNNCMGVYAFNTAALEIFEAAKYNNSICILEQTMAPFIVAQNLECQEAMRFPELSIAPRDADAFSVLNDRERREWELADYIIAPSNFVKSSLIDNGVDKSKIFVIPYGVTQNSGASLSTKRESKKGNRLLFVGEVGLRKGVQYIFESYHQLLSMGFIIQMVGAIKVSRIFIEKYKQIEFLGVLPRSEMSSVYDQADILVLPSVCEGSATVIYEALSRGLKVVCSYNSGPPNVSNVYVMKDISSKDLIDSILIASKSDFHIDHGEMEYVSLKGYEGRIMEFFKKNLEVN